GEGIAGAAVTVTDRDNGLTFTTTSNGAGGYELAVPAGPYTVSVLGVSGTVTVGTANVKVDFRTNTLLGVDAGSVAGAPAVPTPQGPDQAGVFRDGQWVLDTNHNHVLDAPDATYTFGQAGDKPIVGDWNGDGQEHIGVFRNVGGVGQFVLDTN